MEMNVMNLNFDSVALYPTEVSELSSRSEPNIYRSYDYENEKRSLYGFPLIAANMQFSSVEMARALAKEKCFTAIHKYHSDEDVLSLLTDKDVAPYVFYTIGLNKESQDQTERLSTQIDFNKLQVCFEAANGYMTKFLETIKAFKDYYTKCIVMAGNIISLQLIDNYTRAGVNIIKVGIANGGACTTREIAGIELPAISLIDSFQKSRSYYKQHAYYNDYKVSNYKDFHICSDGGVKKPADFVKSLAFGSDFTMLGTLLASSLEAQTQKISEVFFDGDKFEEKIVGSKFYGMSSNTSMKLHSEQRDYRVSEGVDEMILPYSGPVINIVRQIQGGVRSAMTYLNCKNIEELAKVTKVIIK